MVLNRRPEEIEDLIIIELFKNGELSFTELLEQIHDYQANQKKKKNQSEKNGTNLSKATLAHYLEKLVKKDKIVEKVRGRTAKRKNYVLTATTKDFGAEIAENLVKAAESIGSLYAKIDRPFFAFFQDISCEDKEQLTEIRDNLRQTTRMLDFYLKFSEVKA